VEVEVVVLVGVEVEGRMLVTVSHRPVIGSMTGHVGES
jgi:hypothetical protein